MRRGASAKPEPDAEANDLTPEGIEQLMRGEIAPWRPPPLPGVWPPKYDQGDDDERDQG
jgi:hypothetical protein